MLFVRVVVVFVFVNENNIVFFKDFVDLFFGILQVVNDLCYQDDDFVLEFFVEIVDIVFKYLGFYLEDILQLSLKLCGDFRFSNL